MPARAGVAALGQFGVSLPALERLTRPIINRSVDIQRRVAFWGSSRVHSNRESMTPSRGRDGKGGCDDSSNRSFWPQAKQSVSSPG
jgi:hypothetical protein